MAIIHEVAQGECLTSIAHRYGVSAKVIWAEAANAALRKKRKSPTVLAPGDLVTIPDAATKAFSVATGKRHRFVIRRQPAWLRVRMLSNGRPIANEPYDLTIDDMPAPSGTTTADGIVQNQIKPNALKAIIHFPARYETHTVNLGHLDPVEEMRGLQARLHQLGYYRGRVDGENGPLTAIAVQAFQKANGLDVTGAVDAATETALVKAYGQ